MDAGFIRLAFFVAAGLCGICLVGGIVLAVFRLEVPKFVELIGTTLSGALVGILVQIRREERAGQGGGG